MHPLFFNPPSDLADCLLATQQIRDHPNRVSLRPGGRHWGIFSDLCRVTGSVGNAVADAYRAALAIEHGCELMTTDRGFGRFPGLRWRHPLDRRLSRDALGPSYFPRLPPGSAPALRRPLSDSS